MRFMKISVTKEIYWTIGTAIITGTVGLLLFNVRLCDGQLIKIQFPDTDADFSKQSFLLIVFATLLTGSILARTIYYKLDNRAAMGLLALLLVAVLAWQFICLKYISGFHYHFAPVVDKGEYFKKQEIAGSKEFRGLMWTLILATGAILATVGIKFYKTRRLN